MQELMLYEGTQVEVLEIDSIIYFNPYHVAKCLGLGDSAVRMAISKMTKNQAVKLTNSIVKDIDNCKLPPSGKLFLTESGVYKLAFKSNKPNAEAFTNWVADEVLPAIRKTGKYELHAAPSPLLEQNILTLKQTQNQLIEETVENSFFIGELRDRLEYLEDYTKKMSDFIFVHFCDTGNLTRRVDELEEKASQNFMRDPEYQRLCQEIIRIEQRYHQHNQQLKSIRTDIMLHRKEHNPEAYKKPVKTNKSVSQQTILFDNIETLFNDMKDQYQSFITPKSAIYRIVEINNGNLRFQVNKCNTASMDVLGVTKGEKKIVDGHGVSEYKVYFEGCAEPIIFTAIPKRL